ncbi:MAG: hypothetical protein B7733_09440 [Myxococcales bacterium FL481]|nr:MAG: hypothetical protein B7733_09440 [Myxococcales bacterium FL481]
MHNPWAASQTPEVQRMGLGRLVTFRRWGVPEGQLPPDVIGRPAREWARGPSQPWGIGDQSTLLDEHDQHMAPSDAAEVVRSLDVQRCVRVDPSVITPAGVAYELVRIDHIPTAAVGVIERVPTTFANVEALDDVGPVFTYGDLNGERPCTTELVHPDAAVTETLRWSFRVTLTHVSTIEAPAEALSGPIPPEAVPGDDLLAPWSDLRYGSGSRWADRLQLVVRPNTRVRYWGILFGPADRFAVTIGARLAGYWQLGGRKGSALQSATTRIV